MRKRNGLLDICLKIKEALGIKSSIFFILLLIFYDNQMKKLNKYLLQDICINFFHTDYINFDLLILFLLAIIIIVNFYSSQCF